MKLPEGEYWMYLRKSRADVEAETRGEGETLAKHKKALFKFAKDNDLNITRIYQEVVSGESLLHRIEMMKLLKELEEVQPKGILVMDYDRLGRGDKLDQGLIERALKEANTLIVTPTETIDLNNDSGELTADIKGLFARMELKQITKRMQGGRRRSVETGNYIGTRPPYGYSIFKSDKGERYLIPDPEQSEAVKLIFELYTHSDPKKRIGSGKISNELNKLGYKPYTKDIWVASSVLNVIKNAVYAGRIQWGKKESKKSKTSGKRRDTRTRPVDEWIDVKGKHEPIISLEIYQKAQEILKGKYHVPFQLENGITNPLAGLIRCGKCGASMILRPYTKQLSHIMCYNKHCDNKSSRFLYVEEKLMLALSELLKNYVHQMSQRKPFDTSVSVKVKEKAFERLAKELQELESQKMKLHDFLERGIYDDTVYLERSKNLADRIANAKSNLSIVELELKSERGRQSAQSNFMPTLKNVVESYYKAKSPATKNQLLKSIILSVTYIKEKSQRNDEFSLTVTPKIK